MELKSDFFFNFYGWKHSTMKNLQESVPLSPQDSSIKKIVCPLVDGL